MTFPLIIGLASALALPQTFPSAPPVSPAPIESSTPAPVPPTVPTAASSATPGSAPAGPVSPAPLFSAAPAGPSGAATPAPSAYAYRFVPRQPAVPAAGAPQIFAVYLNAKHLKSHGPIMIRVETSPSVVKVESKSNGRGGAIPMAEPGVFFAQSTLPGIPFIASGMTTDLIFTGTTADGRSVTVRVPVELG